MAFYMLCWFILQLEPGASKFAEDHLYRMIMEDYQKEVRPTLHHWLATNVTFGFLLQAIVDLDEKNQILTTRAWMNINWMDQRLAWDPLYFGNITSIQIPNQKIWKPDIILTNNADHNYQGEAMSTDVFVTRTGNVTWLASAIFKSACRIRVKYFPFDDQECMINFTSWSHNGNELHLVLLTEEGDLSSYTKNSEFNLTNMIVKLYSEKKPCCPKTPWPTISIAVKLTRSPFFYIFNHILPGTLLAAMGMTGFLIPPDSGEKVTMCITTMLAMGVYLKTVTEQIPASEELPMLGMYYAVLFLMVGLTTMGNIWVLNLHMSTSCGINNEISEWTRIWILDRLGGALFMSMPGPVKEKIIRLKKESQSAKEKREDSISLNSPVYRGGHRMAVLNIYPSHQISVESPKDRREFQVNENFREITDNLELTFGSIIEEVYQSLVKSERRDFRECYRSDIVAQWKALALVLDRFLLLTFVFVTAVMSVAILFQPAYTRM